MQYIDIKDSQVKFINENEDPLKRAETIETDLATMVFESMNDKMKITQLETDLGNAVLEIMNLKLGGI